MHNKIDYDLDNRTPIVTETPLPMVREDTHKKSVFFSGRTTKGVGRVSPLTTKHKKTFFSNLLLFEP